MNSNSEIIKHFYEAFKVKDFKTMQSLYHVDAKFSDPVFTNLTSVEVKAMWQMLITASTDLIITYSKVEVNENKGSCHWEAIYTFTRTGKKVHNRIKANFEFSDGKINHHIDEFDFYRWSRMAFGFSGILLGWTTYFKNKVKSNARERLNKFIEKNNLDKID